MRRLDFASIAASLTLAGCGVSKPNDADLIAQLGLNDQVSDVVTGSVSGNPNDAQEGDAAAMMALAVKVGATNITPANDPPYWSFNGVPNAQENIPLAVGHREIDGRDDVKTWKDGAVEHFAETIRYHIEPDNTLRSAGVSLPSGLSVRLVASNDPAIGHWQIDPAQSGQVRDGPAVHQALVQLGHNFLGEFSSKIQAAQKTHNDSVEQQLSSRDILARSKLDPLVLTSKRAKAYIYVGYVNLNGHNLSELERLCNAVTTKVRIRWHAPTYQDYMNAVVQTTPSGYYLIDTPDRRLFAQAVVSPPNVTGAYLPFWTTDAHPYVNNLLTVSYLKLGEYYNVMPDTRFPHNVQEITFGSSDRVLCMSPMPG
jgi:hypothetical protein